MYLPKIGFVHMHAHRHFDRTHVTQINVKRYTDQWMVNITVKVEDVDIPSSIERAIGIDVGLNSFAALSDETTIENPRHLRIAEKRLKRDQRRLSRKQKGSRNREKAKRKVAKAHRKVARQRNDFLHKQSFHLVRDHDLIAVEKLNMVA